MSRVRLVTRGSDLALVQARSVAARLEAELGVEVEILPTSTTGDRAQGGARAQAGAHVASERAGRKGLFVKELEEALLQGRADLAIHSAKDLPAWLPEGLALVAYPEVADPRDALVARRRGCGLGDLAAGSRVGTGSARRTAQLRALRPDLEVVPLRGNVPTRLARLERDDLDAVVLACAGLDRLGLTARIDERLAPERMLPAVGQGVLALEGRRGESLGEDAAALTEPATATRMRAERAVLEALGADCNVPLAAHAVGRGRELWLRALLADPDGGRVFAVEATGAREAAERLGTDLADELRAGGGGALLVAAPAGS